MVSSIAIAATVDLSGMSYDELLALKDQINLAMWASEDWQEVTAPQGTYKVGEDIPAGHWTIRPGEGLYTYVKWGDALDESGKDLGFDGKLFVSEIITSEKNSHFEKGKDKTECDFDVKDGQYIIVESGDAVFTPYTGKPGLGFK